MFDINSPEAFFRAIRRNARQLHDQTAKETDRLLFVVFGLNHLREWIAPDYSPRGNPMNENEKFYELVYSSPSFRLVNSICNHTKHLAPTGVEQTGYGLTIDKWPEIDSIESFDAGPPTSYAIDGEDVLEAVDELIELYQREWFDRHRNQAK